MIIDFKDNDNVAADALVAVCKLLCRDRYTADITTEADGKTTRHEGVLMASVDEEGEAPCLLVSKAVEADPESQNQKEPRPGEISINLEEVTVLSL